MRLVKPSYEIWDRTGNPLALIELAGRVCYQSEPKGDPEGFVQRILSRRPPHASVLEHAWFAIRGYRPFPLPAFMEYDWEREVLIGNARAWRNAVRKGKTGLPFGFADKYPALFGDLKQHTDPIATLVDMPDGMVFTVNFIIDRGVSHELVRHRPPSFSQESTRFCCYDDQVTFVIPPWLDIQPTELGANGWLNRMGPLEDWLQSLCQAECHYLNLLRKGWVAQQARSVLPNSLKTQIVVTAFWTEWQTIFALRAHSTAHPQMQEVMCPLQQELATRYPNKFGDKVIAEVRDRLDEVMSETKARFR